MKPRIEIAEILSFRLKVPPAEIQRLPEQLAPDLDLIIENDHGQVVLAMSHADSYLAFSNIGTEAVLSEILLCNDDRGMFFHRVLGALMVRYQGDLHLRLTWNVPERNSHGAFTEVHISHGVTTYPGLGPARTPTSPQISGGAEATETAEANIAVEHGQSNLQPLSPQDIEIEELLVRARAQWDEYQRLKSRGR